VTADTFRLIDTVKDALLRDLGQEVDLIFRYGSTLKGTTHAYSDLDISYTPRHESTWHSITVLVDEMMIDLYPIHWSKLGQMAEFDDISSTVLLQTEVVYQRSEVVGDRFRALPAKLLALQMPDARPSMLSKAQAIFQGAGYQYYLLRQASGDGHQLACMHNARNILQAVLHCLAVANQACIDTRKLDQVLALPMLPAGFAETIDWVANATDPEEVPSACERLLHTTRTLLLAEQQAVQRSETTFPVVFDSAYPELKGDLQHLMLACERHDLFGSTLMSLYHELMIHMAQATTGVEYSDFNSLSEYEQDLTAMGFPELLPFVAAGDFTGLHRQCKAFDRHLQAFLTEHSVPLNSFGTIDELQAHLDGRVR
jgi:hypothetical protein